MKPPLDVADVELMQFLLDFQIAIYDYDMNTLDDEMKRVYKQIEAKRKKRQQKRKMLEKQWGDLPPDLVPFIENLNIQYEDRPFEKGNGIDFYIDSARFLPDNVTVTKVVLFIVDSNGDKFIQPIAGLAQLQSMSYMPIFSFRQELRAPHFNPTLMAFISIETLENQTKETRVVGYAAINFFVNRKTKKQVTSETDTNFILMNGKYQIPIYCQEPLRKTPFNMESIFVLDKMPCASLLVRINRAPMSDDYTRALGLKDAAEKDWQKTGIWTKSDPYSLGRYNTTFCQIRDSEKELFQLRQRRTDCTVMETTNRLMSYFDVQKETKADILKWIDEKIQKKSSTEIIDLIYFAKYQQNAGFKFSVDGYHQLQDHSHPHICIYYLNPPQVPMQMGQEASPEQIESQKQAGMQLNSNFKWDSPLASPIYNEGFFRYKDVEFDRNLVIVVDIRKVIFSEKLNKANIEYVGWTIVPVFTTNGYIRSGIYQMPVFKGQVRAQMLEEMQSTDPWPYIEEQLKNKVQRFEYLEPMSVIVRLLDAQREGHYQTHFDHTRMLYDFLPRNKRGIYTYNNAVEKRLENAKKIIAIAPNKFDPQGFNEKITAQCVKKLGIQHDRKEVLH